MLKQIYLCIFLIILIKPAFAHIDPKFIGSYNIYYSWGCSDTYKEEELELLSNGTFKNTKGISGKWLENNNIFTLIYDFSNTYYSGYRSSNAVVGVSRDIKHNTDGCFYMLKKTNWISSNITKNSSSLESAY